MAQTRAETYRKHRDKRRERGYIRTQPWIPARDMERFTAYVERLQRQWERERSK